MVFGLQQNMIALVRPLDCQTSLQVPLAKRLTPKDCIQQLLVLALAQANFDLSTDQIVLFSLQATACYVCSSVSPHRTLALLGWHSPRSTWERSTPC